MADRKDNNNGIKEILTNQIDMIKPSDSQLIDLLLGLVDDYEVRATVEKYRRTQNNQELGPKIIGQIVKKG